MPTATAPKPKAPATPMRKPVVVKKPALEQLDDKPRMTIYPSREMMDEMNKARQNRRGLPPVSLNRWICTAIAEKLDRMES